jgi:hypothetical protein
MQKVVTLYITGHTYSIISSRQYLGVFYLILFYPTGPPLLNEIAATHSMRLKKYDNHDEYHG